MLTKKKLLEEIQELQQRYSYLQSQINEINNQNVVCLTNTVDQSGNTIEYSDGYGKKIPGLYSVKTFEAVRAILKELGLTVVVTKNLDPIDIVSLKRKEVKLG